MSQMNHDHEPESELERLCRELRLWSEICLDYEERARVLRICAIAEGLTLFTRHLVARHKKQAIARFLEPSVN